ncbi:MAG TPA: TOPRIM nucleotidyl transferase/hydrolase domain-containing protein, partial [Terriglobales bacterium]|nr:TOPRIM nucleotidyl transferase/hydrolase domain-containing protein [Terriglobales bacterium]
NRVISKGQGGTKVDQKPYLKNWRAVRKSLGLILAGTFFIADRTLLVEGESDALYIGAVLAACDRAGLIDVDLNLFSVQWAGNTKDFSPMARLLLEEGREVVAMVDGDAGGGRLKNAIAKMNQQFLADNSSLKPVAVI